MSSRNTLKQTVNTIPPTDPGLGDEWSNISNGRIYKYLAVNGTSPQWVELYSRASSAGLTLPSWSNNTRPSATGKLGYNNTTNRVEFYNNLVRPRTIIPTGSLQFNGNNQSLSIPSSTSFVFGTGDFTIECWFYWNGTAPLNTNQYTILSNVNTADNTTWDLQYYNGSWRFAGWSVNHLLPVNASFIGGTWNHIAVTRASGVGQLWLNGVSTTGPVAFATNLSSQFVVLVGYNGFNNYWNGYITNLRVVKGSSIYNSAFTPTGPLLNVANTTLLLSVANDTNKIVDSSTAPFTLTNSNGVIYSPLTPFTTSVTPGNNWVSIQRRPTAFEYLIVGGGGGGGSGFSTNARGGGGGAGGVVYGTFQNNGTNSTSTVLTITVGGGGAGSGSGTSLPGTTGTNSSLTAPFSTSTDISVLLTDRSTNTFTVTNVGGVIPGTTSTYGNYSVGISFNGTSQRISLPMNSINPGSLDFTIEGWVYPLTSAAGAFFVGQADLVSAGGSSIVCYINSAGTSDLYIGGGSASIASPTCIVNRWSHVAFVRYGATGGTWAAYVNGIQVSSVAVTGAVNAGSTTYPPNIGGFPTGINMFAGDISNFRMTIGKAVYTGSFVVPSIPLPLTQSASGTSTNAILARETAVLLGINTSSVVKNALGGGPGGSWNAYVGGPGASGGGSATWSPATLFAGTSTQFSTYGYGLGNVGSTASLYTNNTLGAGGGGGGAGTAGIAGTTAGVGGYGGAGTNLYSSFLQPIGMGVISSTGVASNVTSVTSYGPAMGSLRFNGSSQYVTYSTATNWTFTSNGAQDYTMECWFYTTSTAYQTLSGTDGNTAGIGVEFSINGNGAGSAWVVYNRAGGASTNSITTTAAGFFSAGAWNHIAYTFVSSTKTVAIYINGVSRTVSTFAGTVAVSAFPFSAGTPANTMAVGYGWTGSAFTNGLITNLRIVKGLVYTGNFNYLNILPLTNIANTQLLLSVPNDNDKLVDSSAIANTFTNVAGVTFNAATPSTSTSTIVYSGGGDYYIGGGGGGGGGVATGIGGAGGGGNGALATDNGSTGTVSTGGGGGGGGGAAGGNGAGGAGGGGVVILRYLEAYSTGTVIVGSPRVVVSGPYRHYIFTSSGVISF